MRQIIDKLYCVGCSACYNVCPKQCITMRDDNEGFFYPQINERNCVNCELCKSVCPVLNVQRDDRKETKAYAAYNINLDERLDSSSGGMFSLFARLVLERGGVVFGAAMADDCRSVHHICIHSERELPLLRGSKYVQSNIGFSYTKVRRILDSGEEVLFSGTPCEIEALKSFLGKEYDNLICIDFICHGVPSPRLWAKYVKYREDTAAAPVQRTFFRHKKYGWKTYALLVEFSNNKAYEQIFSKDLFMQMFLQNICLRPSCYSCPFKKINRVSDITLADFWGCQFVCPELDDNNGLSALLIHSPKGTKLFRSIRDLCVSKEVPFSSVLRWNSSLTQTCSLPEYRSNFFKDLEKISIDQLGQKYLKQRSFKERVVRKIKSLIPACWKMRVKHVLKGKYKI